MSQHGGRLSTILLVEDETLTRLLLVAELQAHGHEVIEAVDADEALSILREDSSIGLLFADIKGPGTIDGLELARITRAEHPRIKIIIGSAHGNLPEWSSEAHAAFSKPYDLEKVIIRVNQLLRPEEDEADSL